MQWPAEKNGRVIKKNMTYQTNGDALSLCLLASGSRGNATYISWGETSLLFDAGLSGIEIQRRLAVRGIDPGSIDAIVISHEHSDHIQGAGILSRRFEIPIYISSETHNAAGKRLGRLHGQTHFTPGSDFKVKELDIHPFSIPHDAADPAGFTVSVNGIKVGLATDLGIATAMVKERLKDCAALVLEANHDPALLMDGPYPWQTKQRIKSRTGHLSNMDTKNLLCEIKHSTLTHVALAHLSETNNTPQKALKEARDALSDVNVALTAACQSDCGEMLKIMPC